MRSARVAIFAIATAIAMPAYAQPKPPPAPSPAPAAPKESALAHLSSEIASGLGQVPAGALVSASPLTSDVPAPKGDELAVRIASQVAGKLGTAKAHPQPASLAVARGLSGRAASLVHIQLEIAKGELRATADLYPVVSNGWERLRNPVPGPRAHAFASVPLDAEIRSFMAPILLEQASVHKAKHEETDVVAIGCGDVDQDGGLELVIASRTRVVIGKLRGGKLVPTRVVPWSSIASRSPTPLREPLASVVVSPRGHRGEIHLGSTDRGGVAVDGALVTKRQLAGLPVPGSAESCVVVSTDAQAFEGNAVACENVRPPSRKSEATLTFFSPSLRFDAVAAFDLVGKDGSVTEVLAGREPTGKLRLRRTDSPAPVEATIDGVGAQLAIADLDLDGVPEIVTTSDGSGDDVLAVTSWTPKGTMHPRLRVPAKEGVRAVATCPAEEKGVPAVVAVVGGEVWLVR